MACRYHINKKGWCQTHSLLHEVIRLMAKFSGQLGRWGPWIFSRFWILYGCSGGRDGSHWIDGTFEIQTAWFLAREVEYGSSFDQCSWFLNFLERWRRLSGPVFTVCWAWSSQKTIPSVLVGTKKMRDETLRRFVVVSPREVTYLMFSCPFKI